MSRGRIIGGMNAITGPGDTTLDEPQYLHRLEVEKEATRTEELEVMRRGLIHTWPIMNRHLQEQGGFTGIPSGDIKVMRLLN